MKDVIKKGGAALFFAIILGLHTGHSANLSKDVSVQKIIRDYYGDYEKKDWNLKIKKFDVDKIIVNKDEAFARYTCWTTDGKFFRNTEYFKFKDGKIKEIEVFFGTGIKFPGNK
jgi:hypothetical protein